MSLLTGMIAVYYFVTNAKLQESYAAQQKSYLEQLSEESRRLALQSSAALNHGGRLQAIRYALQALPDEKKDRPVKGEAVLALQNAVSAYVPQADAVLAESAEFITDGSIHKWDAVEVDGSIFLAVDYGESDHGICLWNVTDRKIIFDLKEHDLGEKISNMDFLLTPSEILLSMGGTVQLRRLRDGALLWEEEIRDAFAVRFLDTVQQKAAMDVFYSRWEYDGERSETPAEEEIQIRRLTDGTLENSLDLRILEEQNWKDSETDKYLKQWESHLSMGKAFFSDDGRKLALTVYVYFDEKYIAEDGFEEELPEQEDDENAPSSLDRLFLIDIDDMGVSVLCDEQNIDSFAVTESGHVLVMSDNDESSTITIYGDGARASFTSSGKEQFFVRAYSSRTGEKEWETILEGGQNFVPKVEGDFPLPRFDKDAALFVAGTHAEIRAVDTGALLHKVEFPGLIVYTA